MTDKSDTKPTGPSVGPVKSEVRQVPFSQLRARPEDYAFREADDFNPEALKALMEDISAFGGIHTSILVQAQDDGTFMTFDGHRRRLCLQELIAKQVGGFTAEMLVPVHVMPAETSELDAVARGVSANVNRETLSPEGRCRAAITLQRLRMPEKEIARVLQVSVQTIGRALALGSDDEMLEHVRNRNIAATVAAMLLKLAIDKKRVEEFKQALAAWIAKTKREIAEDVAARATQDEDPLPPSELLPQRRMATALVQHWKMALEKGKPLDEPTFKFKAMIKEEGGRKRLEVDGVFLDIARMTVAQLAKIYERVVDLADQLEPELVWKAEEEKHFAGSSTSHARHKGRARLKELGLASVMEQLESAESSTEETEPVTIEELLADDPESDEVESEFEETKISAKPAKGTAADRRQPKRS